MDRGHLDMQRLAELLIEAAKLPRNANGMVVSAPGALTIAARALNELAKPLDAEESEAYSLETMAKHLERLREAVAAGDAATVANFFNLYVFD